MSLEGTFETLALTEVLEVLSHSKKCGVLLVEAGPADGRIWVEAGKVQAVESGEQAGPVDSPSELLNRAVDAGFTLARQPSGSFRFVSGERPPFGSGCDVSLGEVLDGVERLLGEWRDIQEVIPSLEARPRLRDDLAVDEITLDARLWRLVVTLDGRRTVRDVVHRSERTVLDICHALKGLVEMGAVEMVDAPAELPHRRTAALAPVMPYGPGVDRDPPARPAPGIPTLGIPIEVVTGPIAPIATIPEPHLGVVVDATDEPADVVADLAADRADPGEPDETEGRRDPEGEEGEAGRDRRALLRLFSALREA